MIRVFEKNELYIIEVPMKHFSTYRFIKQQQDVFDATYNGYGVIYIPTNNEHYNVIKFSKTDINILYVNLICIRRMKAEDMVIGYVKRIQDLGYKVIPLCEI